jgi:hypothetical protein
VVANGCWREWTCKPRGVATVALGGQAAGEPAGGVRKTR